MLFPRYLAQFVNDLNPPINLLFVFVAFHPMAFIPFDMLFTTLSIIPEKTSPASFTLNKTIYISKVFFVILFTCYN
jgi:hypothetical protein